MSVSPWVEDSSKRLAGLLWKLNAADVSASVCAKLVQLCAALEAGDVPAAMAVQAGAYTRPLISST
jgi:protein transport protein SEC31